MSSLRLPPTSQPSRSPRSVRPSSLAGSVGGSTSGASVSSGATVVPPPSLLTTLTQPTTEGYPATDVIKFLVNVVGRDVVSFRRNAQVSYLLVDRARDICDSINTHIKITENGSGTDSDWASFEKFSDAIDPVEDALFKLTAFTEDERALHVFKGDSVHDCIAAADNLVANRDGIWQALNLLETSTELTSLFSNVDISSRQAEREQAQIHDDGTFLGEVIEEIDDAFKLPGLNVPPMVVKMIENLRDLQNRISTSAISPALTIFTLKAGLLVQGVSKLAFHTDSLDPQIVAYLRSPPIWAAASKLVEVLNSTRDDGTKSMDRVNRRYDDFLNLLVQVQAPPIVEPQVPDVPKSYIELLKVAGQVRRPFHSQAVALISLCRALVKEFGDTKNRTQENLVYLDEALTVTLNGLRKAVDAVTELRIFDLDNFEGHPAYQNLQDAQASIKKCHDRFFELGGWIKWEQFIADALRKDKERMGRLNELLGNRPSLTAQDRADQIELTIQVVDSATSRLVYKEMFPVEGSTRLSAVRWIVARGLEVSLIRRARERGEFVSSNTRCDLHDSVSQYTGSNRKCALQLNI